MQVLINQKNNAWSINKYVDNEWTVVEITNNIQDSMRGFNIANLTSSTYYNLKIVLENNLGKSLPNEEFIFKTLKS